MTATLDLRDIQGNIVRAYGRYGFPHARYFLFHFEDGTAGRKAVRDLLPLVTTSERWTGSPDGPDISGVDRPKVTLNLAFSWLGLLSLEVPVATLAQFPPEFIEGMPARGPILSDVGPSGQEFWDPVWRSAAQRTTGAAIHMLVSLNAQMQADAKPVPELDQVTDWLRELGSGHGVKLLRGHGQDGADYQQASARMVRTSDGILMPDAKEHFGFEDGTGDPVFEGQYSLQDQEYRVHGRGKLMPNQTWQPLATGEFLIGYPDESQELPQVVQPPRFVRNGTFMAFRKLHENVRTFDDYVAGQSRLYAQVNGIAEDVANLTLRAKMVGRWPNGAPLMAAPTYDDMLRFEVEWADIPALQAKSGRRNRAEADRLVAYDRAMSDFRYADDPHGVRCPISAHIRRGNMRDMLDPYLSTSDPRHRDGSAVTNRRRILRRGLPYGPFDPPDNNDSVERGVIFMVICSDLFRQFEFVLQQWINFGLDFSAGNDTCPLLGRHHAGSKFIIQADPEGEDTPWIMNGLPQFVTMRGGEYFFVPGLNTLSMIAEGLVDPT